ncbi:MAG TPA: sigma-54 dependent transcriptional regulator [Phycisphaerae bacterium]|nr:sigma-54 dependent transcriptional regulator [Phycisphaerae bacterium]
MKTATIENHSRKQVEPASRSVPSGGAESGGPAFRGKVLLAEDDAATRESTRLLLEDQGYEVVASEDGAQALQRLNEGVAVIITDLKMRGVDGMQLLHAAREQAPQTPIIMITGHGSEEAAVAALKSGAFHYLKKPIHPEELLHLVREAIEKHRMSVEIAALHQQINQLAGMHGIIGQSKPMRKLFETIRLVADTRSTVLIEGESGTGKELVARALHLNSSRRNKPFVAINCAAIPEALIESELFGHVRGAFTGAADKRVGTFLAADRGTLLIDEIGEMQLDLQSKLLRAIETRRICPLGSNEDIELDVRLIASTHRDLQSLISQHKFREDLYYRLNVVNIKLPPLRERREDIPLLVRAFIEEIAAENNRPVRDITPEALARLQSYDWPGNVRQLRNVLESVIVMSTRDVIEAVDFPEPIREASSTPPLQALIAMGMPMCEIEKEVIRQTLQRTGGNRSEASKILGISTRTLQRRIKEHNLLV